MAGQEGVFALDGFVEKPSREWAPGYLNSGDDFWNSGMFLFPVALLLQELERFAPDVLRPAIGSALRAWPRVPALARFGRKIALFPEGVLGQPRLFDRLLSRPPKTGQIAALALPRPLADRFGGLPLCGICKPRFL